MAVAVVSQAKCLSGTLKIVLWPREIFFHAGSRQDRLIDSIGV